MSIAVKRDHDYGGTSTATNLKQGVNDNDAATMGQLRAAIEGLAWKDDARVDATVNVNLASPGAAINGVNLNIGERFVPRAQTAGSENGIYIFNGASTPATRAPDANTFSELTQAVVSISEGPNAGATFRQTAVGGTLGTTTITWSSFLAAAPLASESTSGTIQIATQSEVDAGTNDLKAVTPLKLANWSGRFRKANQDIGDGTATSFTVTHNFNTRDVRVTVFENSGLYREVIIETQHTSVNAITLVTDTPVAANALRVTLSI